ncbi:MAG: DNA adenine methylase [Actinomycetota bacterium]|nr:DNA adenine methylase [Actinomycetota bacterium]
MDERKACNLLCMTSLIGDSRPHRGHRAPDIQAIKYIGSKRRLVPVLGDLLSRAGAETALDLFTGTTRVAQEFKNREALVTTVDSARYSEVFSQCHVVADATEVDKNELREALSHLAALPGNAGYFTETFCIRSRYFQPFNGQRVDAIRNAIEHEFRDSPLYPILLASLIYAADRVDSTTGVQMAYVKDWAPRSFNPLELRAPQLYVGTGTAVRGDACVLASTLPKVDLAYLDPPYNQHRYFTNYHIWETLVAWDAPEHYGVACKRIDSRDPATKSLFNLTRSMPNALSRLIADVRSSILVLSYNNESWVTLEDLIEMCEQRGHVSVLAFDSKRYVGAQIGIYNPNGQKVGRVSHLRNLEYVLVAGERDVVIEMTRPYEDACRLRQEALF